MYSESIFSGALSVQWPSIWHLIAIWVCWYFFSSCWVNSWATTTTSGLLLFTLLLFSFHSFACCYIPIRYCLVLRSFLRIIRFKLHSKRRIASLAKVKYHGNRESARNFASLCSFCAHSYLLASVRVCFATCNWHRQTFEFPRWLHVYIASIDSEEWKSTGKKVNN